MKANTVRILSAERFDQERYAITKAGYKKNDLKAVLKAYDLYVNWANIYMASKWIFFKYHFEKLWEESYTFPYQGSFRARAHNTANESIDRILREIGKEKGWLK